MAKKQKMPAILFYTGDWLKDPAVRCVCLEARGLWIDMLCLMYESPKRGYLALASGKAVDTQQLARMVGTSRNVVEKLLEELLNCGVYSIDSEGIIFSRRMVADEIQRENKSKAGKIGMQRRYNNSPVISDVLTEEQQKDRKEVTPLEYEIEIETKEYVSSPEKFAAKNEIEVAWQRIPKHKQIGIGRFRTAWVREVTRTDTDPKLVADKLEEYYNSDKGRSEFARNPVTLIEGEFWLEHSSAWHDNKEVTFSESPFDHEKIIQRYCEVSPQHKDRVHKIKERGGSVASIAYKIWEKYPEYR
jgi:hypothetical protein